MHRNRAAAVVFTAVAAAAAALVASPSGVDAKVSRGSGLASKKAPPTEAPAEIEPPPLLATLVQTHTDERVPLDDAYPSAARFSALLADRVTGERHVFDPRLLDLLRSLSKRHPAARIELVSGYRSPKLNEMMRKKGRHVASHSQHSLGHAVDFRIVPAGEERGVDPRILEKEIRDLGWEGGVGVYTLKSDWFVHADVGNNRRWGG
ncbi:MAG: DUF882 domain-containing protein [Labilithrix sp.]|nr:DUF882 domain-containing protein [Labilithrix sp.]